MKKISLLSLPFFLVYLVSSCEYDYYTPEKVDSNTPISLSMDIAPMFAAKGCVGCHKTGGTAPFSLEAADVYQTLVSRTLFNTTTPAESLIITKISVDGHAGSSYTATEIDKIKIWVEQGALDN